MPVYSISEFKASNSVRKIELEDGKAVKIWIPSATFLYKRIHFNIKKYTTFKESSVSGIDCLNSTYGEKGKGCPICEQADAMWEKYRAATDKKEKDALKAVAGQMLSEEFWMNVLLLTGGNMQFHACRFTGGTMKEIQIIENTYGVQNVVILYKMAKEGEGARKRTKYTLSEDPDQPEVIEKLKAKLQEFMKLDYAKGGLVDLEAALMNVRTSEDFYAAIEGRDASDTPSTRTVASDIKVEESATSLDELSLTIADDEKNEDDADSLQLNLEDEGLVLDLDLDMGEEDAVIMKEIDARWVKNNQKSDAIGYIHSYLVKEGVLEATEDSIAKIKAVFAYVKKEGKISVPRDVTEEVPF